MIYSKRADVVVDKRDRQPSPGVGLHMRECRTTAFTELGNRIILCVTSPNGVDPWKS